MLQSRWACLFLGIIIGAVVGANVGGLWPQIPVHATATHGQENFAIATGPIGIDVEAVYILDYLTGELKAAVAEFADRQVHVVLRIQHHQGPGHRRGKNPRYLMVTGMADMRKGGQGQLGSSVVYIAEFTSGNIAAYGLPWTMSRAHARPVHGQVHSAGHHEVSGHGDSQLTVRFSGGTRLLAPCPPWFYNAARA